MIERVSTGKSLGCGLVKRTRISGSICATRCSSSGNRTPDECHHRVAEAPRREHSSRMRVAAIGGTLSGSFVHGREPRRQWHRYDSRRSGEIVVAIDILPQ